MDAVKVLVVIGGKAFLKFGQQLAAKNFQADARNAWDPSQPEWQIPTNQVGAYFLSKRIEGIAGCAHVFTHDNTEITVVGSVDEAQKLLKMNAYESLYVEHYINRMQRHDPKLDGGLELGVSALKGNHCKIVYCIDTWMHNALLSRAGHQFADRVSNVSEGDIVDHILKFSVMVPDGTLARQQAAQRAMPPAPIHAK